MKQTLSELIGAWKQAARERLFPLLDYAVIAKRTTLEGVTELGEELRNQMTELQVKLGVERNNDVLCA